MVPTTRNQFHHDGKNNSKSCYPSQYCVAITAQLEASSARQDHHKSSIRSLQLTMADDDELAAAASTGSHVGSVVEDDGNWLQLGLAAAAASSASSSGDDNNSTDPAATTTPVELGLFTCSNGKQHERTMRPPPLFPLPLRSYQYGHGRYRPTATSESMSAPFLPFMPPFRRSSGDASMRVISPPRRTESTGLWLTLEASPNNQCREPILPQIPKSYLRIKDSNMKVEVVMKYLADKLGLTRPYQVYIVRVRDRRCDSNNSIDRLLIGGADMPRAGSSSVLAGEIRKRQHLVLVGAQGRRGACRAARSSLANCYY